jgi:hypothetical protein
MEGSLIARQTISLAGCVVRRGSSGALIFAAFDLSDLPFLPRSQQKPTRRDEASGFVVS